jgi:hypothetical protein
MGRKKEHNYRPSPERKSRPKPKKPRENPKQRKKNSLDWRAVPSKQEKKTKKKIN